MAVELKKSEYLMFRGKPLVRKDDTICYGDLQNDKYVLLLDILGYKDDEKGHRVPNRIFVQVVDSKDFSTIKNGNKDNMYDAFLLGVTWLNVELMRP
ncbi:MAG: hypothetical protein IKS35_07835 [Clostridia bacterium]|nr:hypothetical protein [Clostridia bacterium]